MPTKIIKRAVATKRSAKPAPTAKPVKRALGTKTAHLGKNTAPLAAVKPANKPATVKPANAAKAAKADARRELLATERSAVVALYGGPSPTFHANAGSRLANIVARIANPTKPYNETERTASLAVRIAAAKPADLPTVLCAGADLGVIAMLASGGILAVRDGAPIVANRAKLRACIVAGLGERAVPAGFKA